MTLLGCRGPASAACCRAADAGCRTNHDTIGCNKEKTATMWDDVDVGSRNKSTGEASVLIDCPLSANKSLPRSETLFHHPAPDTFFQLNPSSDIVSVHLLLAYKPAVMRQACLLCRPASLVPLCPPPLGLQAQS